MCVVERLRKLVRTLVGIGKRNSNGVSSHSGACTGNPVCVQGEAIAYAVIVHGALRFFGSIIRYEVIIQLVIHGCAVDARRSKAVTRHAVAIKVEHRELLVRACLGVLHRNVPVIVIVFGDGACDKRFPSVAEYRLRRQNNSVRVIRIFTEHKDVFHSLDRQTERQVALFVSNRKFFAVLHVVKLRGTAYRTRHLCGRFDAVTGLGGELHTNLHVLDGRDRDSACIHIVPERI